LHEGPTKAVRALKDLTQGKAVVFADESQFFSVFNLLRQLVEPCVHDSIKHQQAPRSRICRANAMLRKQNLAG
jgi:hypothetical protein